MCSETAHTVNSNGFSHSALKTFGLIRVDKSCIMSILDTNQKVGENSPYLEFLRWPNLDVCSIYLGIY